MSLSESEALERVEKTFEELEHWRADLGGRQFIPGAGSALALDDEDWPTTPTSQVVTMGLASAQDHLAAVAAHVKAGELFHVSHLSLVRGALIGAAQAVWILAPDQGAERIERSREVAAYLLTEHLKYLRSLQTIPPRPHPPTDDAAEAVAWDLEDLRSKRGLDGQNAMLNTTEMVRSAARAAFSDAELVEEAVGIWRRTSGAAHGALWSIIGHGSTKRLSAADEHGMAAFEVRASLSRLANPYLCAFRLAKHGWSLRQTRGS